MNGEIIADAKPPQAHSRTLFGWLVLVAMIVALFLALRVIISPRPRVLP